MFCYCRELSCRFSRPKWVPMRVFLVISSTIPCSFSIFIVFGNWKIILSIFKQTGKKISLIFGTTYKPIIDWDLELRNIQFNKYIIQLTIINFLFDLNYLFLCFSILNSWIWSSALFTYSTIFTLLVALSKIGIDYCASDSWIYNSIRDISILTENY